MQYLSLAVAILALTACSPLAIKGRASSAVLAPIPATASFFVTVPDVPTLGDRHMADLLSTEMRSRGFVAATEQANAQLAVAFQFILGAGSTAVLSMPNYTTGGSRVYSETEYPRFLQIWLLDWPQSEANQKPVIIWQAELYSEGSGRDLSRLADSLVPQAFKLFGQDVTNRSFVMMLEPGFR